MLPQEAWLLRYGGVAPKFTFTTRANTVQLLTVGQADIGFTVSSNVVLAHAQDIPVRPFYNILTKSGTAITVLDDSPITSAEQLRGGTIGTATVGVGQYFNGLAMVAAAGLDPETDVEWVSVGVGAQALQALESGTVDAIVLWDAAYADMENKGAAFRYFRFPFQNEHHSAQWMATDEFIDANRAAIIGLAARRRKRPYSPEPTRRPLFASTLTPIPS
ncbi:MAG: ABC transporter substrate-binding protein [Acidimicrobiia bacterium]|nr:ABC transporter substrate-binding protein [Acidimicrobiia bacterium]